MFGAPRSASSRGALIIRPQSSHFVRFAPYKQTFGLARRAPKTCRTFIIVIATNGTTSFGLSRRSRRDMASTRAIPCLSMPRRTRRLDRVATRSTQPNSPERQRIIDEFRRIVFQEKPRLLSHGLNSGARAPRSLPRLHGESRRRYRRHYHLLARNRADLQKKRDAKAQRGEKCSDGRGSAAHGRDRLLGIDCALRAMTLIYVRNPSFFSLRFLAARMQSCTARYCFTNALNVPLKGTIVGY